MAKEEFFDKLREMIARCKWTFAKTMPFAPHEYIVRDKCPLTEDEFVFFVNMQRQLGVKERWGKYNNSYLYIDDYKYWTMGASIEETKVINRAKVNVLRDVRRMHQEIQAIRKDVEERLPHQVNTIQDLYPDEPKVSSILAGFFKQRINGNYQVFNSFINYCFGSSFPHQIDKPVIEAEIEVKDSKRVDILVYEKGKYAIVFENKIWDAVEQPNQLANYIEGMHEPQYGFTDEQIFIVYLPSTEGHKPSDTSWGKTYQKAFADRYRAVSFREGIIEWLESNEIKNIDDECFTHSRFLFVDYLKKVFNLTVTDNMENKKIDEYIHKELELNDNDYSESISKITGVINEISDCSKQLERIRKDYYLKVVDGYCQKLREHNSQYPVLNTYKNAQYIGTGIVVPYKDINDAIYVLIGFEGVNLIYGATYNPKYPNLVKEMRESQEISRFYTVNGGQFKKGVDWLFYKGTTIEEGYERLCQLIKAIINE